MISAVARRDLEAVLGDRVCFGIPLARHTSLRVGGPADAIAAPANRPEMAETLAVCHTHRISHMVLGSGFNALVRDGGYAGVVIRTNLWRRLEERPGCGRLPVEGAIRGDRLWPTAIPPFRAGHVAEGVKQSNRW